MYEYIVFALITALIFVGLMLMFKLPVRSNYYYVPNVVNERLTELHNTNIDKFNRVINAIHNDGFRVVKVTINGSDYYYITG